MTRNGNLGSLALAGLLLVLAAAWLLLGREPRTGSGPVGPAESVGATGSTRTGSVEAPPVLREPLTESEPEPASPPSARGEEPSETDEAASRPVLVLGDAIRVEKDGLESVSEDGGFALSWWRGAALEQREIEVRHGSWSAEVPADALLRVRDLELGGVPISPETDEFPVPADHHIVLRGTGRHAVRLHVLSQGGQELTGVEVWLADTVNSGSGHHPGAPPEGEAILRGRDSPVLVPPRFDPLDIGTRYFVHATGHAWDAIQLDHRTGGERTLVLPAEAALEIQLLGSADWLEPQVRLWPPDAGPHDAIAHAVRRPDTENRAVFEALAPGTYRVSVERGWGSRRVSYGSALVDAVAGERLLVEIAVALPERPVPTHLSGTLVLPLAWEHERLQIDLGGEGGAENWMKAIALPLEEMRALPEPPTGCEAFAFEATLPIAGDYRLEVTPTTVRRLLHVPEEGLDGLEVRVPPPATAEVRVIDAATGEEIRVESIYWSAPGVEGILGTPLQSAPADARTGRPTFRAPEGTVLLHTRDHSLLLLDNEARYELGPGKNELELPVRRLIGVHFTFKDGDAEVPWDWSWRLSARRENGTGDRSRSIGILWFLEEGVYELHSEGFPGYRSIDGTLVDVVRGQGMIEVEIPLVHE